MRPTISLRTDYFDYYDHYLDLKGDITLHRWAGNSAETSFPHKLDQFKWLEIMGEPVIPYGEPRDLYDLGFDNVVLYTDTWMHAGRGKILMDADQAILEHPEGLVSGYVVTGTDKYVSYKYLQLGVVGFDLKVTSTTDWRTNVETEEVEVLDIYEQTDPVKLNHKPVYAIDYVVDIKTGNKYAIDLNWAPGCRGLGVRDYLSGPEVYRSLQDWYTKNN